MTLAPTLVAAALLSFRDGPSGPSPESMNTGQALDLSGRCSWIPGSQAQPAPRNDRISEFFRTLSLAAALAILLGNTAAAVPETEEEAPAKRGGILTYMI